MKRKRNDKDREQWVMNDEPLYLAWKSSRMPIRAYIRECREEIDAEIDRQLDVKPLS